MDEQQRKNLHKNTSILLKYADAIVQKNYLTQLYAIDPNYATSVYEGLPHDKRQGYSMEEVAEASKTAHLVGKNPQFMTNKQGLSFMGMPVGAPA